MKLYARDAAEKEIRAPLAKLVEKISAKEAPRAAKQEAKEASTQAAKREEKQIEVDTPSEGFGEFSTPLSFSLGRELKRSPHAIAQELAAEFEKQAGKNAGKGEKKFVEKAVAAGGYVNFHASQNYFENALAQALEMGGKYGTGGEGKGRVFVIEYSDPNVGKPFHVGHIRGTILGKAIANLRKFAGWKTFEYVYLGDAGTQVAKLVVALDEFKQMRKAKDEKQLLQYYVKIHEESAKRPELEERARATLEKIEAGDPEVLEKVEEIRKISMRGFEKNWKRLGVKFDFVTGENAYIQQAKQVVGECLRKGIASKDEKGGVVLELEEYGIPNTILMRSNGTTLYLTRDFPREEKVFEMTKQKFGRHYDESLIITASEQNTHFRQLYKSFELLGRPFAQRVKHLGFGLVALQSGKISSREGRVVFLEDVLDEAKQLAKKEILSRELPYSEKEVEKIAEVVGKGSVKFAFLRVGSEKNITYSPEAATRFSGDSGAYLQYTCVRAKNILRKAVEEKIISGEKNAAKEILGEMKKNDEIVFNESEKKLVALAAEFPLFARSAAAGFQPHALCEFLLRVGAAFSEFYENCPVLKAEGAGERMKRLAIVRATQTVLENGLGLLGIEVPERM